MEVVFGHTRGGVEQLLVKALQSKLGRQSEFPHLQCDELIDNALRFKQLLKFFKAAKAEPVEYILTTPPVKLAATALESPPNSLAPQLMTDPLVFKAAKAQQVEYILTTPPVKLAATALKSPPKAPYPQDRSVGFQSSEG